jgi:RNA polymerase sigma factor (sigma-70 family)
MRLTDAQRDQVEANLGLAHYWANRVGRNGPVALEDRVQAGCMALIVAAQRFDPARDCKFVSYASAVIKHAIRDELNRSSLVRVPRYLLACPDRPSPWRGHANQGRRSQPLPDELVDRSDPAAAVLRDEDRDTMLAALANLNPTQRAVFERYCVAGQPASAIAAELGKTRRSVIATASFVRQLLRRQLQEV